MNNASLTNACNNVNEGYQQFTAYVAKKGACGVIGDCGKIAVYTTATLVLQAALPYFLLSIEFDSINKHSEENCPMRATIETTAMVGGLVAGIIIVSTVSEPMFHGFKDSLHAYYESGASGETNRPNDLGYNAQAGFFTACVDINILAQCTGISALIADSILEKAQIPEEEIAQRVSDLKNRVSTCVSPLTNRVGACVSPLRSPVNGLMNGIRRCLFGSEAVPHDRTPSSELTDISENVDRA